MLTINRPTDIRYVDYSDHNVGMTDQGWSKPRLIFQGFLSHAIEFVASFSFGFSISVPHLA